jgi:hypothetical protein
MEHFRERRRGTGPGFLGSFFLVAVAVFVVMLLFFGLLAYFFGAENAYFYAGLTGGILAVVLMWRAVSRQGRVR